MNPTFGRKAKDLVAMVATCSGEQVSDTSIRPTLYEGNGMDYRRYYQAGGTYFFTVVSHRREPILIQPEVRVAVRQAIETVRKRYPFEISAWVLLPDHLHTIWQLPDNDVDFSERWRQIKRHSQYILNNEYPKLWQPRFWEHYIRDEKDFARHYDYVHFNPVKHGYVKQAADWPYSTFHRCVKQGIYSHNWGGGQQDFTADYDE